MQGEIAKSIVAAGIKTNYHDCGSGEPVLLIHGSGPGVTAWANWRTVIPELSKTHRVIALDVYGFGYTEFPDAAIRNKSVWIKHIDAFLDVLGIDQISVVGNSFGGAIALALMISRPERVRRSVLMGAVGIDFPITEALDYVWGYSPSFENMKRALGYLASDPTRLSPDLIQARFQASTRLGVQEAYTATFGAAPRQNHIAMLASSETDIRQINQEVLILHGRLDQVIPKEVSLRLGELIPRSDVHLFSDCGHWVQIERAGSFNAMVTDFLSFGLRQLQA